MSFQGFRSVINGNFTFILLGAFFLGLFLPGADRLPAWLAAICLGAQIYCSSFRISFTDIGSLQPLIIVRFYLIRFLILPVAVFFALEPASKEFALSVFLFLLLPPGMATPGLAAVIGANAAISLVVVTASSLLAPVLLPFLVTLVAAQSMTIDGEKLFLSTLAIIFIPIVLHLPLRLNKPVTAWFQHNSGVIVTPLIAMTTLTAVGNQRAIILRDLWASFALFLISLCCYFLLYWGTAKWKGREGTPNRLSFCLASGTNNITLGLVLALLNFPPAVILFMALAHASWIASLIVFRLSEKRELNSAAIERALPA